MDAASTSEEALEKVTTNCYVMMFLDIFLPDLEGTNLLKKLPEKPEMVKIIIAGHSDDAHGILRHPHALGLKKDYTDYNYRDIRNVVLDKGILRSTIKCTLRLG